MKFSKMIEEMRTVRDYKKEPVSPNLIQEVMDAGKTAAGIAGGRNVSILFIDHGKEVFDQLSGKAGYYGKMVEAPHYLVITSKVFPNYLENSGYIMELMRLKSRELDLGTCWLSVEDEGTLREILGIGGEEKITAFAAIGHSYKGIFKHDMSKQSTRMGLEEIAFLKRWGSPCTLEDLEARGLTNIFYYTRLAPSWGNRQPWQFIIDKDRILLTIQKEEREDLRLDAGVVMLYFEKSAHDDGLPGNWKLDIPEDMKAIYGIPEDRTLVGYYSI
ncbi:nitroreductase [Anaerosolibacter carboniphilus]|uniref:Nitroreductase n=1 Tax=Anaerosolibacter carboniphilus TaxID=1417629 RepID=A0A841L0R3_9FIRM|nr:nitroreductase family protein [Anaerosolibacter carboniphilus]MBB6216762.1 nitroreductase [Anaerosolibacter carboniphilus]